MPGIFISYRRGDSGGYVGRLDEALKKHFVATPVFRDIDSIAPGLDFLEQIGNAIASCNVLLAVIGSSWLVTNKDGLPRLMDSQDFVRQEIQEALARNVRVIPVLVQGAAMPSVDDLPPELSALARRNAVELSDTRWEYDVGRLLDSLGSIPGLDPNVSVGLRRRLHGALVGLVIAVTLILFEIVLGGLSLEPLERTVLRSGLFTLPLLGVIVGAAIGNLGRPLRGAVAGAAIGGLETLIAWLLGWWLVSDATPPSAEAVVIFRSIMFYLPGAVIASAVIGAVAAASIGKALAARVRIEERA
jgi:hypothetical protein